MLKAPRVKLIYYFGLFGIIGLHLNLFFNELEFPHPAKYIHYWHSHCTELDSHFLSVCILEAITRKGLSQKTDMGYFNFCSRKGFVDNYRINLLSISKSKCALESPRVFGRAVLNFSSNVYIVI